MADTGATAPLKPGADDLVGRDEELTRLRGFLNSESGPAALLVEGEAGIGKTTLWKSGIAAAQASGHHVLACRPGATEASLSYAVLGDLLGPVLDGTLSILPPPQRQALEVALLLREPDGPSPRPARHRSLVGDGAARTEPLVARSRGHRRCAVGRSRLGCAAGVRRSAHGRRPHPGARGDADRGRNVGSPSTRTRARRGWDRQGPPGPAQPGCDPPAHSVSPRRRHAQVGVDPGARGERREPVLRAGDRSRHRRSRWTARRRRAAGSPRQPGRNSRRAIRWPPSGRSRTSRRGGNDVRTHGVRPV